VTETAETQRELGVERQQADQMAWRVGARDRLTALSFLINWLMDLEHRIETIERWKDGTA